MRILIIEDDPNKLEQVRSLLVAEFADHIIEFAHSYQSGRAKLLATQPDVAVLDMQLPTFDKSPSEDGGRRRCFAGRDLLRQISRHNLKAAAVIVTQYQAFQEEQESLTLSELKRELEGMKIPNYKGLIYYHPKLSNWKDELVSIVHKSTAQ